MKVYHGSTQIVNNPLVDLGRDRLDFGKGFYVTSLQQQAIDWAIRPINKGMPQYLNSYELDIDAVKSSDCTYILFESYNDAWLDFVIANRHGEAVFPADVVEGGIANDRVFNTIELYDAGLIVREEALNRLRYEKPNNQICILNQDIIDKHLHFVDAQLLNNDGRG